MKFDGEICGGVLVENVSDDFPSKRNSKISFQTSPEVCHQFRRKLRQLHSGNRWCLKIWGATKTWTLLSRPSALPILYGWLSGIALPYRPSSFRYRAIPCKFALLQGVSQLKLLSAGYRAIEGYCHYSIARFDGPLGGIQWRAPGHSVNRRTLKTEKLLSSSPPQKSLLLSAFQLAHSLPNKLPNLDNNKGLAVRGPWARELFSLMPEFQTFSLPFFWSQSRPVNKKKGLFLV